MKSNRDVWIEKAAALRAEAQTIELDLLLCALPSELHPILRNALGISNGHLAPRSRR